METITKTLANKWFALVVIMLMLAFSAVVYSSLPDEMPRQWSFEGEVNSTWPRWAAAVVMPALAGIIWLMWFVLPTIDPRRAAYESFRPTYNRFRSAVIVFLGAVHVVTLTVYDDPDVVVRIILVGMALLVAFIGNELTRVRPTWFVGIRTPWTLSSDAVWRRTHRVGGRLMFVTALIGAVLALVLPTNLAGIILIGGLVLVSLVTVAYSYWAWTQEQQSTGQTE